MKNQEISLGRTIGESKSGGSDRLDTSNKKGKLYKIRAYCANSPD